MAYKMQLTSSKTCILYIIYQHRMQYNQNNLNSVQLMRNLHIVICYIHQIIENLPAKSCRTNFVAPSLQVLAGLKLKKHMNQYIHLVC